jgi:type VI secretion system secreted protein VgrG
MSLTQDNRIGELITPLGKDVLVLRNFDGIEGLSELFEFHVDALSEQENVDFDGAIGQSCTVKLKTYEGKTRIFDGILTDAQWIETTQSYYHYRLVLSPWFELLDYKADCRCYLDKSVIDILKDVFGKAGFNDYQFKTTSEYDPIPYCVQYCESDFAFCSRLMERFGIYYFFKHEEGKHTMVLADSRSSHEANPDVPKLPYLPLAQSELDLKQRLGAWTSKRRFSTGKIKQKDYDFTKPPKDLEAKQEAAEKYSNSKLEYYDWRGKYTEKDKGEQFAKIQLEAEQALDRRRRAEGDAPSVFPGSLITLENHPTASENTEYLAVRATHRFGTQDYLTTGAGGESETYSGRYEFLPSDRPYRTQGLTDRPRIYGIQTGVVVAKQGEDGEEISTDEYGRIWVKLPWDSMENAYPMRVAQVWAGNQWGGQFIPRIGMEVVVEYEQGDPDHPLVVGCLYNGNNMYPYDLPGNKTQSGVKSDSSKGHNGYNEIMFEDTKGGEFIRMHAELDHLVTVNRHQTASVGAVDSGAGPGNQTYTVGGDRSWTLQMGNDTTDVQMGNQTITLDMGSQTVEALQGITLSVCMGMSTVVITPASVAITSPMIDLTADATISITAPIINITGIVNLTGMLNITGGMTVDGMVPMLLPA